MEQYPHLAMMLATANFILVVMMILQEVFGFSSVDSVARQLSHSERYLLSLKVRMHAHNNGSKFDPISARERMKHARARYEANLREASRVPFPYEEKEMGEVGKQDVTPENDKRYVTLTQVTRTKFKQVENEHTHHKFEEIRQRMRHGKNVFECGSGKLDRALVANTHLPPTTNASSKTNRKLHFDQAKEKNSLLWKICEENIRLESIDFDKVDQAVSMGITTAAITRYTPSSLPELKNEMIIDQPADRCMVRNIIERKDHITQAKLFALLEARKQPKESHTERKYSERYAQMSEKERNFNILLDLGMAVLHPDPDSGYYDTSIDNVYCADYDTSNI